MLNVITNHNYFYKIIFYINVNLTPILYPRQYEVFMPLDVLLAFHQTHTEADIW